MGGILVGLLIVACEIGFWLFILVGLTLRYVFRQKKWGAFFLICTPILDLILLAATYLDLRQGAVASVIHGLAAVYIGVSLAFGHQMVKWADVRFAYRFAGGPKPKERPKYGKERSVYEIVGWTRHLVSYVIGAGLLFGLSYLIQAPERTEALIQLARVWGMVLGIDFVISISYVIWPKKHPQNIAS